VGFFFYDHYQGILRQSTGLKQLMSIMRNNNRSSSPLHMCPGDKLSAGTKSRLAMQRSSMCSGAMNYQHKSKKGQQAQLWRLRVMPPRKRLSRLTCHLSRPTPTFMTFRALLWVAIYARLREALPFHRARSISRARMEST